MTESRDIHLALSSAEKRGLLAELLMRSGTNAFPLSLSQQRLWFLDQLEPGNPAYHVPLGLRLKGNLNTSALQTSLQQIVSRHDILRTVIGQDENQPAQVVGAELSVELPCTDLSHLSERERESEAFRISAAEARAPFDLGTGPLLRARLLRLSEEEHVFICVLHHIVCDAWSVDVLLAELAAFYNSSGGQGVPGISELKVQYGDYAQWQREWMAGDLMEEQVRYWKEVLKGAPSLASFETDQRRPAEQSFDAASQTIPIPDRLIRDLSHVARQRRATLFMLMLAAFKALFHFYTGSKDVLVGVPVSGRNRVELERLMGFFVNTLVFRTKWSGDPRFIELVSQVREVAIGAFAHADLPFERLVEEIKPARNLGYNPVFQIMVSALRLRQLPNFDSLTATPYLVTSNASPFDLFLTIIEDAGLRWWIKVDYSVRLFEHERITNLLADYKALLGAIALQPRLSVSELREHLERESHSFPNTVEQSGLAAADTLMQPTPIPLDAFANEEAEPGDSLEQTLAVIWRNVLGVNIGIRDDFFDRGGHSLIAARLMSQVRAATGHKIPLAALFRAPTIESLAALIREGTAASGDPFVMPLRTSNSGVPFFAVAEPGVDALGYAALVRNMAPDQAVYKLQADSSQWSPVPFNVKQLRELARDHIAAMRTIQSQGPYCLGGACVGVYIAEQMVLELEAQGYEVGLFMIIDTWVQQNRRIHWLYLVDAYWNRFRSVPQMPWSVQLPIYREVLQKFVLHIVGRNPRRPSPWEQANFPGKDFRPRQFRAPVLLFKVHKQPYYHVRDPELGWSARSTGGVQICLLEGTHDEMFREPNVRIVADRLMAVLRQVQGSVASRSQQETESSPLATPG